MLSEMQLQQYSKEGYLLLPELVAADTLADLNQRFLDIVTGLHPCSGAMKIMRDVMVVKGAIEPESALHGVNKLFCLEDDDVLNRFAALPELVRCVQSLIGDEIYSLTSNVFNKPPRVDGKHPLHQDIRYFSMRPVSAIGQLDGYVAHEPSQWVFSRHSRFASARRVNPRHTRLGLSESRFFRYRRR